MDKLFRHQENIKDRIVKSKINFGKQAKDKITLSYVETRLENVDQYWQSFNKTHDKIMDEISDKELEASDYYNSDVFIQVEDIYVEYKSKLKECLYKLKSSVPSVAAPPTTDSSSSEKSLRVQLPKITIPTFTGKYNDWTSFKDLFISLVHNNKGLDDVQKLHYLKTHIQGEAEQLLKHIPVTADNYSNCWSQLEKRYDNKRFLANCVLKRFMSLKAATTESSSAVKELLDVTNECLHALENLGVNVSTWDIIVIFIVSQKLDTKSRELWETTNNTSLNELPKLCSFIEFLETRFRTLECIEPQSGNKQGNSRNKNAVSLHVANKDVSNCIFCSQDHKLCNCKLYAKEDVAARRKFAQTSNLCFNCLSANHSAYTCRQSTRCRLCKRKHHTLLHPQNASNEVTEAITDQSVTEDDVTSGTSGAISSSSSSSSNESTKAMTCLATASSQVLLATALVNVESKTGSSVCLRSLLDQGSQASFITESSVQLLKLKKNSIKTFVSGLGGDQQASLVCKSMVSIKIQSRLDPSFIIPVKAYVLPNLTTLLPERKVFVRDLPVAASIELADPSFDTPNKIDLLLGAEVYSQIMLQGFIRGPPGSPIAQNTTLGWILSGTVGEVGSSAETCHNAVVNMHSVQSEENSFLKRFCESETEQCFTEKKHLTGEEQECERLYEQTTERGESGRYVVRLPFRTPDPQSKNSNSQHIARNRFLLLEKRLLTDLDLKGEYIKVINEYLDLEYMKLVQDKDQLNAVYLPHHAVVRNNKLTTETRIFSPTLQAQRRHML